MSADEAIRLVFRRASEEEAFSSLLWSDPVRAGQEQGLQGWRLYELVGAIERANRSKEQGRRQMVIVRDCVDRKHRGDWRFDALSEPEVADRGEAAEGYAEFLLRGIAMRMSAPEHLDDVAEWASVFEAALRKRADSAPEDNVDLRVALALIQVQGLQDAISRCVSS